MSLMKTSAYYIQCDECEMFFHDDDGYEPTLSTMTEILNKKAENSGWAVKSERHYCPYCRKVMGI